VLLRAAAEAPVAFFSGKGGVGKTTVASAVGLGLSHAGRRVLLVSPAPAHSLGHVFDCAIGRTETALTANLWGLEVDPQQTVQQHLDDVRASLRRLMPVHLRGEIDRHLELAKDAPGMLEAAMLERIAEVVERADEYDHVIFDTAPSGHTARLMALPEIMSAWTDGLLRRRDGSERLGGLLRGLDHDQNRSDAVFGDAAADRDTQIRRVLERRRQRFSQLRSIIGDPTRARFFIVLTAERLPALETIEFQRILAEAGIGVAGLVVNKRLPAESGDFLSGRRRQEQSYLDQVRRALPDTPVQEIALETSDIFGLSGLAVLREQLGPV